MKPTYPPDSKGEGYLGFLDGIRGGAALWVLLAHCMIWGGWYGIPLPSAKIAVDIFMVSSGFLMVYQYRRREKRESMDCWKTAVRFWMRRFFRIAPVYYLSLLVLLIFWDAHVRGITVLQQVNSDAWAKVPIYNPSNYHMDWINTMVHAMFLFGLLPNYAFSNMSPDWSIGLEMQFYAAFPLLYFLFRKFSWVWMLIFGVLISEVCNYWFARLPGPVPGTSGLFAEPSFLLMKLPFFFIGMLVGETFCRFRLAPISCVLMSIAAITITARYSIFVSATTATMLWLTWNSTDETKMEHGWITRLLNRLLGNKLCRFLADTSFSVYLLHGFCISFLGGYLFQRPNVLALSGPKRVGLLMIVVIPTSYLAAWFLRHALEKPAIGLGRRLVDRWFPLQLEKLQMPEATAAPAITPMDVR